MTTWLNKYKVASPQDIDDLDRMAAVYQFHKNLPPQQAEDLAYGDYLKIQHCKAAGYHLDGMSNARDNNDWDSSKKAYSMYALHAKALGRNPMNSVGADINAHRGVNTNKVFVPHPSDIFVLAK